MDTVHTDHDATKPSTSRLGTPSVTGGSSTTSGVFQTQFVAGDIIDNRYQILSLLGKGGFGCVYKVVQTTIKKEYALKTLNPINATDMTIQRLRKEGQAAGRLDHPNLVRAVDFGMLDGVQPYLVMDLVEGPTLSQYLKQHGKASIKTMLQLFIPLCRALAYAHEQGVIHRDLKPSNVILAPDDTHQSQFIPKIVDFGIAKIQCSDESHAMTLTGTGDVFGTPLYMSPEQCMGTGVDSRSDIYALGCMMFETLTGAPPFSGANALEIMMQHGSAPVPSLREASLGELFPPSIERIVNRMLAKDPKDRYQDCKAVARDLSAFERGDVQQIEESPTVALLRENRKKQRSMSILCAAMGTIAGATIGYAAHQIMTPPAVAPKPEPKPVVDVRYSASILDYGLDSGFHYFSKSAGDSRTFEFPKRKLGELSYWHKGKPTTVEAKETVTVPRDAKLSFRVEGQMLLAPDQWSHFHVNELDAVVINLHSCYVDDEPFNQSMAGLMMQDQMRIFSLNEKSIFRRTLFALGNLPNLRWLDLRHVLIDDKPCTGDLIGKLANLHQLQVLRVDDISKAGALVSELAKHNDMRRFGLVHTDLTDQDIEKIGSFEHLDTLSLRDYKGKNSALFAKLTSNRTLKRFAIESEFLASASPETLQTLHPMTIVTRADELPPEVKRAIMSNKSITLVQDNDRQHHDGGWFDVTREDPDTVLR